MILDAKNEVTQLVFFCDQLCENASLSSLCLYLVVNDLYLTFVFASLSALFCAAHSADDS